MGASNINSGDVTRGREALQYYHNYLASQLGSPKSFNQRLDEISKPIKNQELFLSDVGWGIRINDARDGQVNDAMILLAKQYADAPPPWTAFSLAIARRISEPTTTDYFFGAPTIAAGIASDIGAGAASVGNAILDTSKSLLVIGPILIVAAVIFVGFKKVKSI